MNGENLKTLCNAIEEKVLWQREIISQITSTMLQCRSGMIRRKEMLTQTKPKEETWLFFQRLDVDDKEKIARELASLVFSSCKKLVSIGLSGFFSPRADSIEDLWNKHVRDDESSCNYLERLAEAMRSDLQWVFLVEDIRTF